MKVMLTSVLTSTNATLVLHALVKVLDAKTMMAHMSASATMLVPFLSEPTASMLTSAAKKLTTANNTVITATRKAKTMFFKTKTNRRKTTRQTLSTEQLEPKAMFSVSPVEPVVALDIGPVNQAGYDCENAGTCSADGFMKTGDIKGEVKPTERVDKDGRSIVHPQFNVGNDGRMIVHPQFHVGLDGLAQANQQTSLTAIRDVDIASESLTGSADPGGDDVFMPKPNRGVSLHDSVHCLVGDIGKAPFTTGAGGDRQS
jgi:hypothetical protein